MISLADGISKNKLVNVTVASSIRDGVLNKSEELGLKTVELGVPPFLLQSRKNIRTIKLKLYYILSLIYYWFIQIFSVNLRPYDVLCINDVRAFLFFMPQLIWNRKKIVWYIRINDKVKYVDSLALYLSRKIVLISNDCLDVFSEKNRNKYANKFTVVHTGFKFNDIDRNILTKIKDDIGNNEIYISIGTICERKNQLDIVKVFDKLNIKNTKLLLIGDCTVENHSYKDELLNLISKCSNPNNILVLPYTDYVHEYLSLADVFLFASRKEGLPRVVIEAINSGCFVCSSNVDGISDIVVDERLGLYTKSKSNDLLFESEFYEILSNVDRNEIIKNKKFRTTFINDHFSYESFISNFYEVIKKI
ncbi:glycosyltransferase family 4 protein [Aliivibrio fischeri]|uniref:glycosyltransferase family 4 protein n=1 Tax=Aliivibrio fischeri TaxID=668 RepID=UPI00159F17ED|nr:glycosyltransferase family 4 protein [Aliivibrio fischeri]